MTRYRWAIPTALGAVCIVLALVSIALSKRDTVGKIESMLTREGSATTTMELQKGELYELMIVPSSVPLNDNFEVSATLVQDDAVVFEVADAYWYQRGVWHEGGESGTWEEKNTSTDFQFRVPESGTYELELALDFTDSISGRLPVKAGVVWHQPWVLSMWPLLLGGLVLFGFGGWTAWTVDKHFARLVGTLGVGSKLKVNEREFEVIGRSEHWEQSDRVGVDLRLRDTMGNERYLAYSSWWEEYTFGDEDYERTLEQLFVDVTLTDDEKRHLATVNPNIEMVELRNRFFYFDKDNSGAGLLATERGGEVYINRYYNYAYRSTHAIPRNAGEMWLECTVWRNGNDEKEWSLTSLVESERVEILEHVEATMVKYADLSGARDSDPFGVRNPKNADPFGARKDRAQQQFVSPQQTFSPPMQSPTKLSDDEPVQTASAEIPSNDDSDWS